MNDIDQPTPVLPDDAGDCVGPIHFDGDSPTKNALQLTAAIQGVAQQLDNLGLKAQDPESIPGSSTTTTSYGPGNARYGRLIERYDELEDALYRALKRYQSSNKERNVRAWAHARIRRYVDGEWRPLTQHETIDKLDLNISQPTLSNVLRDIDAVVDQYLSKRGWTL
jgi:hypothetical protein